MLFPVRATLFWSIVVIATTAMACKPAQDKASTQSAGTGPGGKSLRLIEAEIMQVDPFKEEDGYNASDPVLIQVTLYNTSNGPLSFLPWGTPFDQDEGRLVANAFDVTAITASGKSGEASYHGVQMVRASTGGPDPFVTIPAGGSKSVEVDIGRFYRLPKGEARITFERSLPVRFIDGASRQVVSTVDIFATTMVAIRADMNRTRNQGLGKVPSGQGCRQSGQQGAIRSAFDEGSRLIDRALADLRSVPFNALSRAPRFLKWFGPSSAGGAGRVEATLLSVSGVLKGTHSRVEKYELSGNCACDTSDKSAVAFIQTLQPFAIHFCPGFFDPMLKSNFGFSQAGVVVNLLSRFRWTGRTRDSADLEFSPGYAGGHAESAVRNADSYRKFVVNKPPLPMVGNTGGGLRLASGEGSCNQHYQQVAIKNYVSLLGACPAKKDLEGLCRKMSDEDGAGGGLFAWALEQDILGKYYLSSESTPEHRISTIFKNMFGRGVDAKSMKIYDDRLSHVFWSWIDAQAIPRLRAQRGLADNQPVHVGSADITDDEDTTAHYRALLDLPAQIYRGADSMDLIKFNEKIRQCENTVL